MAFAGLFAVCGLAQGASAGSNSVALNAPSGKSMTKAMPTTSSQVLTPIAFSSLPGWDVDDHLAAWKAFVASCKPIRDAASGGSKAGPRPTPQALLDICQLALATANSGKLQTRAGAKAFFEVHFQPNRIDDGAGEGLLTGYYEPLIEGSRKADASFQTPVYKRPTDLVNVVAESERGAKSAQFTHMRKTDHGLVPYLTRAEIEQGGLKGQNLELLYFHDPVDVFFMQIQGSGRIELPDGQKIRITYDGKNGYPYKSVGRHLIDEGHFEPEKMSLKALAQWLKADRKRGEAVMWENKSYVFFRELAGAEAEGAMGVLGISLQAGRSLAVDTAFHDIGMPVYVTAPTLTHASKPETGKPAGFARLMIAHDVGSAIKGPERGDIFFGSGDKAGRTAGITKHPGHFFTLLPVANAGDKVSTGPRP